MNSLVFSIRQKQKQDFLAYFEKKAKSKYDKWMSVYLHFKNFTRGQCTFGDVTVSLCEDFRDYLLIAYSLRHPEKKIPLSANSAAGYWSTFRCLLKMAYKEKLLLENVNDFLDGLKWQEVKKEYITLEEMKILANSHCDIPVLKRALYVRSIHRLTSQRPSSAQMGRISSVVPMEVTASDSALRKTETEATLPYQ